MSRAAVIGGLLPREVRCADLLADAPDAVLWPGEDAAVSRAVPAREREFATGRLCARLAMARLGIAAVSLPPGERGEPQWPPGLAGSITHCAGYRGAAVARTADFASVGIDAVPAAPLPEGVLARVASRTERSALSRLARCDPGVAWDRLLFSAKESVYKAWSPLAGRPLGFRDAVVALGPNGDFTVRLLVPGPRVSGREVSCLGGRWGMRHGLVLTAVTVPVT
jgi:4'-phosphopantetheinyl transferase EntD